MGTIKENARRNQEVFYEQNCLPTGENYEDGKYLHTNLCKYGIEETRRLAERGRKIREEYEKKYGKRQILGFKYRKFSEADHREIYETLVAEGYWGKTKDPEMMFKKGNYGYNDYSPERVQKFLKQARNEQQTYDERIKDIEDLDNSINGIKNKDMDITTIIIGIVVVVVVYNVFFKKK